VRIVLLGTEFAMNGAALLLFRWASHLAERGHQVTAVHAQQTAGPLRDAYAAAGVTLTDRFGVDRNMLVICNTVQAAKQVLEVARVARTVWWLHEGEVGLSVLMRNPGSAMAFHAAHAVIFPSASIRERVYKSFLLGVPEQRLHHIAPGLEPLAPGDADTPSPSDDRPVRVIAIGSIYPRKRPDDLIRAVAKLPDLSLECLLVGQVVALAKDATELVRAAPGRIRLVGQVPHAEAMRLLAAADILALPSSSECMPLTPLEAGLRGKAVLLSDLPAHDGIWRHGVNCLMHPVGDVDLMAHSLRILVGDAALRTRLGNAARRTASAFRNDVFLARLDTVLAGLM
jgi:glycosyltransferase involved in cell wall biosynthesis